MGGRAWRSSVTPGDDVEWLVTGGTGPRGVVSDARDSGVAGEPVGKGSASEEEPGGGDWIHLDVAMTGMLDQSLPSVSERPRNGWKGFMATRVGV